MKAAVLHNFGETPHYEDFPDPVPSGDEKLIRVKAVVLENVNKMMAKGTHYSGNQFFPKFPAIIGHSGIGTTEDGTLVSFMGIKPPYGAFAEKAVASRIFPIPQGIDAAQAAAIPSATLTSLLPLKYTAKMQQNETVLINGATGVAGKLAIQVAKKLGAKRIIGTGRNEAVLNTLKSLGADAVIQLKQTDEMLLSAFSKEAGSTGYNIVLDYLWGHPAQILMQSFIPATLGIPETRIRYIHIGEKAGKKVALSGDMLRTSGLEIYGIGNLPQSAIPQETRQVWEWIKQNELRINIEKVPLSEIENAWQRDDLAGKRLVIIP